MIPTVGAPGPRWPVSHPFELQAVENFIGAHETRGHVGLPEETSQVPAPRIGNSRVGTPRQRRALKHFIRASSPELERQVWQLAAGQIDELPKPPPGTRRVILAAPESIGERSFCLQLGDALTKLGHEWCVCSEDVARMTEKMNPNFFISLWTTIPPPNPTSGIVSLLYIHSPYCISPARYQHVNAYDNFLFAQSGTAELEEYFRKNGKSFRKLKTYLSLSKTDFCDSPKKRIVYVGYLHDPRRRKDLAKLFQMLDKTGYCDFYGPASSWRVAGPHSWKGEIPVHGLKDVQDIMETAGIALILHAGQHFESGSAVIRDFEAPASSCVIITEKTAFMQENFGDCALFIDTERPVEEIFKQIDDHVKWIHEHPEEAIEMARRSHKIFCDKFSLEGECEKILKFVDEISAASHVAQSEDDASQLEAIGSF